ncbi:MAG: Hpt domain-containing protein, partial [Pseudomonadota bacterium]|nr:Hpt domain-containing protein [Pseudomonadota bacterium]
MSTAEPELTPLAAETVEQETEEETESTLLEAELADPDILTLIIDQLNDIQAELIETSETLCNAEAGSEALLTAIETYTEQVQSLWDAAEMAQLSGLQTLCTFINDNVMQIGQQSQRQTVQSLLATWPQLTLDYLQHPSTTIPQLIELVQDSRWPAPLETVATLEQQLRPAAPPAEHYLAPPETLEVISEQIKDVINGLSADLEMCVSMENDNPDLLEAVENYTNQVQAIWDAADMAGLTGLQEVCTFINENLMALSLEPTEAKFNTKPNFERWPALVLAYLQAPQAEAPQLVDLLKQSSWPQPLAEDKADELLNQLLQGSQSPQQQAAYEQEQRDDVPETEAIEAEQTEKTDLTFETTEEEISLGNAEALEILTSELESAKEELTQALSHIKTLSPNDPALKEHIERYTDNVQRLHMAAEMLGLEGLQEVCRFIVDNVSALAEQDQASRERAHTVLHTWPDLVLAYLQAPMTNVIPMVNHFREPQWPQPLPDEQAHALLTLLTQGSTVDEAAEEEAYSRQTQAQPEDVLLSFPEDVNADLLQAYLQEVPQHASDFSAAIQNIIQEPVIAEIERAQRIAHTLKGSSNIIGIKGIANIAHHLEDTLEYLAQHKVAPPKPLTDTMVEAADCIEMMVDALLGQEATPPQAQTVLQSVLDWANRIDKGNLDAPPARTRPPTPESEAQPQSAPAAQPAAAQPHSAQAAAGTATPEQVLRVPTKTIDELMRLVGELSISVGQIQERLKHIIQNTRVLADHDTVLQHKIFELENLVDVRGIGVERNYQREDEFEEDFDPLEFEEYNELYSVTHSFIEAIADNRELTLAVRNDLSELESMFVHQERLNKEFQTNVMTTRMVPVNTIIAKLQRNVRQTCRATGKQAELTIEGADILMDSDVLNNLADPLQHVLRNAIDHGLEMPQERALVSKPEVGHIQLHFYREGNNIVVSCQDDGQGLNYANIRYTAVQRNLIKENQELTEAELARLILTSGFSTKSGVT